MELLEKVRRANSAKSEFLSHMSHDLRTPINGILGMLAIMEKSQDDPKRQRECQKKIRISTERLLLLVNDVLQASKLGNRSRTEAEGSFSPAGTSANHIAGQAGQTARALQPADGDMRPVHEDVREAGEGQNEREDIAGMQVLLVEDNELNCEIMEFMLDEAGAKVVTANDGKAAVDAFAASKPGTFDCVLMDLMMPVMSGFEAARVIRGLDRPDAKTVPIIALSANAFEEDVAMAKDAGMNAHLAKPVDINQVFQAMRKRY